jgi:dienelactone hydrolase
VRRGLVLSVALLLAAGCGGSSPHPGITALPRDALVDASPRIRVSGVGDTAVVRASTRDDQGRRFTSTTTGAELRKDPSKPLWALSDRGEVFRSPVTGYTVSLDLVDRGRVVAHTTMSRRWTGPGVSGRPVRDGLYGELFQPAADGARHAAALVIGGSEGGLSTVGFAALLASHGYPALALAYFHEPGVPRYLERIPLEYFRRALRRLRAVPGVDRDRVAVIGISRGGEGALLIGATYPRLVHGVVALVPSDLVYPGLHDQTPVDAPAWTLRGKPVPYVPLDQMGNAHPLIPAADYIRAERIDGPILTASGGDDTLWPSAEFTTTLHQRLDRRHFAHPHEDLEFGEAGHQVGAAIPYLPSVVEGERGGTARANAAGKAALWPRILEFMRGLRGA